MNDFLSFDLLSIGDASIDVFLTLHEANKHCRLNKETSELCFKYGEKILIDESQFLLGGNGCNVSVGTSKLGLKTSFVTEIGDDEFSEIILKGLKKENVETSLAKQALNSQSNFSIVLAFQQDKVLFARHMPRKHDFSLENVSTKWVYLTSMGNEWKKAYQKVLDYVQKTGAKLAFNPGTTQIEEGVESFRDVIKACDVLFVNKNEAIEITGDFKGSSSVGDSASLASELPVNSYAVAGGSDIHSSRSSKPPPSDKNILLKLKEMGPKTAVITDNTNGSFVIDESGKMFSIGVFPGEVLQKTGAGDAYTSGFLTAIISGESIQEAMRRGAINATAVIQKMGAQTGLLTKNEIEVKLKDNPDFQAKEI